MSEYSIDYDPREVDKFATPPHQGTEHQQATLGSSFASMAEDLKNLASEGWHGNIASKYAYEQALKDQAKELSWPESAMIAAGRETSKLVSGMQDIGNLSGSLQPELTRNQNGSLTAHIPTEADISRRSLDNERSNSNENALMSRYEQSAPFLSQTAGGTLPYILSSALVGPTTSKAAGEAINSVGSTAKAIATGTRNLLSEVATKAANSSISPVKSVGSRMMAEWVNPLNTISSSSAIRNASGATEIAKDPMLKGIVKTVIGNTALGGIEGALHPDRGAAEGALSSLIGTVDGLILKPSVTRLPSFYDVPEQNIIKWAKANGYGADILPGLESGKGSLQTFEQGMKNSRTAGDVIKRSDMAMDKTTDFNIGKAIGMKDQVKDLGPEAIKSHISDLKAEYEDLILKSRAVVEPQVIRDLKKHALNLADSPDPNALKLTNAAHMYVDWLDKLSSVTRNPMTGKMEASNVSGREFQKFRSAIQSDISDSYLKGDTPRAKALEPILKSVDDGLEKGTVKLGSEATSKQWKDLNERWSLTNMVLENGMDPLGYANARKLSAHMLATDAKRYLTGTGGDRLKTLQNVAKFENLRNNALGGSLTSMGVKHGNTNQTMLQYLMQSPVAEMLPLPTRAAMQLYAKGITPRTHPLFLSGKDLGDFTNYVRSVGEYSNTYPKLAKYLKDKISP